MVPGTEVGRGSDVEGFWETTANAPRPLITRRHFGHFGRAILGNLALWPFFELPNPSEKNHKLFRAARLIG